MKKGCKKGLLIFLAAVLLLLAAMAVVVGMAFSRHGGLTGGKCADHGEFARYAGNVSDICVPEQARIVALGEATHGNVEFQQLKLEVFRLMVEKYGVRAFALEADYGACEAVNRYVHDSNPPEGNMAVALGFTLYNTEQMQQLIDWIRQYNMTAPEGEDICFYGFDMQSMDCNYRFMVKAAEERGIDASPLKQMWNKELGKPFDTCSTERWAEAVMAVRNELAKHEGTDGAVHHADILIQNCGLGRAMGNMNRVNAVRDGYMADNVRWVLGQEESRGNRRIFVAAHNGHIERLREYGTAGKNMGNLLADEFGDGYFAIGTDFCKSRCNLPSNPNRTKRGNYTFYSCDPLAKASKECGYDVSWLDFSKVPADSPLRQHIDGNIWMGSIGEGYVPLMPLLPMTYRVKGIPAKLYDGMLLVSDAHPTAPQPLN